LNANAISIASNEIKGAAPGPFPIYSRKGLHGPPQTDFDLDQFLIEDVRFPSPAEAHRTVGGRYNK